MSRRLGCWLTLQAALGLTLEAHWRAFSARPGEPPRSVNHFDLRGYQGMRDDDNRTPRFVEAIERQLAASASTGRGRVVLDIGTGPFALLALAAARAGASRVFALEADGRMAAAARDAVAAATDVPAGLVEVIEGLSTQVSLPEPADLIVAEVVGNVASEEGFVATMRDARDRHAAHPSDPASFIPCAIETLGAPMSYVLHHPALGPEGFDWARVIAEDPPPHFACSYRGLQLLAEPQV
jgi:protein arginine N-methyltransferase 1